MTFVLDASVALAWCFGDEATAVTDAIRDRLIDESALVPANWPLEIANVLATAERRKRIDASDIATFLALLRPLDIGVDQTTAERSLAEILRLARDENLTAYDAAYLDLAIREGLSLATRDKALSDAARRRGVALIAAGA